MNPALKPHFSSHVGGNNVHKAFDSTTVKFNKWLKLITNYYIKVAKVILYA